MRKLFSLLAALLFMSLLIITVSAHAGKTDSNGGHTDSDTGDYHYHHGYSAHDHYDMDGDGDLDCPYDFDDRTGMNSGSRAGSSSSGKDKSSVPTDPPVNSTKPASNKKEDEEMPSWGIWTIVGLCCVSVILLNLNRSKEKEIATKSKDIRSLMETCKELRTTIQKRDEEIISLTESEQQWKDKAEQVSKRAEGMVSIREAEIAVLRKKISTLQSEKDDLLQKLPLQKAAPLDQEEYEIINIPGEVYFVRGNIPVKGQVTSRKPFGDFTVFVAHHGKKYHTDRYCGGSLSLDAVHLYDVLDNKSACYKCALVFSGQHPRTAPDWYRKVKALKTNVTDFEQLTISRLQGYESDK